MLAVRGRRAGRSCARCSEPGVYPAGVHQRGPGHRRRARSRASASASRRSGGRPAWAPSRRRTATATRTSRGACNDHGRVADRGDCTADERHGRARAVELGSHEPIPTSTSWIGHARADRRARRLHERLRRLRHGREPPRVGRRSRTARSRAATTRTRTSTATGARTSRPRTRPGTTTTRPASVAAPTSRSRNATRATAS